MNTFNKDAKCLDFFKQLTKSRKCTLLLDYDGTLAPFKKNRKLASIHPKIQEELLKLLQNRNTKIIIISGRAIKDLLPLLNFSPLPEIWGCHGLEKRSINGRYTKAKISLVQKRGLELAKIVCKDTLPSDYYEIKPFSVAVHVRGLSYSKKQQIAQMIPPLWQKIADSHKLEFTSFNQGFEIRVRGKNKGSAVNAIISKLSPTHLIAYLGDDTTDIDAFNALPKNGLKVVVGRKLDIAPADIRIKTHVSVAKFLSRLNATTQTGITCQSK